MFKLWSVTLKALAESSDIQGQSDLFQEILLPTAVTYPAEVTQVLPPLRSLATTLYFFVFLGVREIGELMGLNSVELERALCSRTMETAKEKVVTVLNVMQVRALLKALTFEAVLWLPH